ncbi:MAG: GNAT family N-acetyltransferase [Acidimicrobiales bacterium]
MRAGRTLRFGSVRSVVTQRMVLRPWTREDRAVWHELLTNEAILSHIDDGTPPSEPVIAKRFEKATLGADGPKIFACEQLDEPGVIVGMVGFAHPTCLPALLPGYEIRWRLLPEFWGRGFATEAATAALSSAFSADVFDHVVACIQPSDHRSTALAERLGMTPSFRTVVPRYNRWVEIHELAAEQWGSV